MRRALAYGALACGALACGHDLCDLTLDSAEHPRWVRFADGSDLRVFVEPIATDQTPVAGEMESVAGARAFRPTFPFAAGVSYRATSATCTETFNVPAPPAPTPEVLAIHPRSETIPANILRFYVSFSEPMEEGQLLDRIRLEDVETGENLTGVFFDPIHELWSPDRRRVTLLVDPGRIKTGLRTNRSRGLAFRPGRRYRLYVSQHWRSIEGAPLATTVSRTYEARDAERRAVDPLAWRIDSPSPGTREPLRLHFQREVDHASVESFLALRDPHGEPVRGEWTLDEGDRGARFAPALPWAAEVDAFALAVHPRFEDLAGNNLNAALDHPVGTSLEHREAIVRPLQEAQREDEPGSVSVPSTIQPSTAASSSEPSP
ncbi:MAG: hypothetical protein AAGE52_23035 [Myxococcota bacterium]